MNKVTRIFIAGHRGLVGSALTRVLSARGFTNLLTRTRAQLDLTNQAAVNEFFAAEKPEVAVLAAAKVGGILANDTYKADFIYQNTMIAANVIHAAWEHGVAKLLNLGSSCIYPRLAPQPMDESALLTGLLESTNEPYAIAKIAAIKLVRYFNEQYGTNFISAMPSNLYGPGDNFDLQTSHVLPALIRRFAEAKGAGPGGADAVVTLWGDGSPMREFLYVDDLADALLFLLENVDAQTMREFCPDYFVNVGTGTDGTIEELANRIATLTGWDGTMHWDTSKPNGTPRKLMNVERMKALGWQAKTPLEEGLRQTIQWYQQTA